MSVAPEIFFNYYDDQEYFEYACRFVACYHEFPPGEPHTLTVIASGGLPGARARVLFETIPGVRYVVTDDVGWDVGSFITASKSSEADCGFYVGGCGYWRRPGVLARLAEAWRQFGPGIYGTLATFEMSPHINTSGFLAPPQLVASYPWPVTDRDSRYAFEWGRERALWRLARAKGMPVKLVTWDGIYDPPRWRKPANIYRRGDQSNCLTYFRHSDEYECAGAQFRAMCERSADTLR